MSPRHRDDLSREIRRPVRIAYALIGVTVLGYVAYTVGMFFYDPPRGWFTLACDAALLAVGLVACVLHRRRGWKR